MIQIVIVDGPRVRERAPFALRVARGAEGAVEARARLQVDSIRDVVRHRGRPQVVPGLELCYEERLGLQGSRRGICPVTRIVPACSKA